MPGIKLILSQIIGKLGYRVSKIDYGEYSYRDDLYSLVNKKYGNLIKGKVLDIGASPEAWAKNTYKDRAKIVTFDQDGKVDVKGDLLSSPFGDNEFDFVFCFETIEHVKDPFVAMQEIKRILKPGGIFIGSAPFIYELHGEEYGDYWRITRQGWQYLLKEFRDVDISWFGKEERPHHYLVKAVK